MRSSRGLRKPLLTADSCHSGPDAQSGDFAGSRPSHAKRLCRNREIEQNIVMPAKLVLAKAGSGHPETAEHAGFRIALRLCGMTK